MASGCRDEQAQPACRWTKKELECQNRSLSVPSLSETMRDRF
ncbi:DUF1431 domain-containing protein [Arthrobacter sp. S41]|nr:DUF1431 domain-containing protein [Arthrobacter sp. S41]